MLGLILNQQEVKEIEYLIKRELDEILFDLNDERIDNNVKNAMMERYQELFSLFKRVASPKECLQYLIRNKKYVEKK
ncbi:hypothetical protein [Niallia sp. 01092]|uniref:hypothetical protein n=1 Tax=unclassified Niallia TaxID=2837522 RepID=UPI003FD575ED